jgi:CheY-like chemotaxis protein
MKRLLIVDDDPVNREMFRWALSERFNLDELKNGEGAAAAICSGDYQLVVLDIMMPVMNGVEVIESIPPAEHTFLSRVVMVTAAINPDIVEKLRSYPVADVIERPYLPDEINALVDRYLHN